VKDKHHHQAINATRAVKGSLLSEDLSQLSTSANSFDSIFFQEDIFDKFRCKHNQTVFGNS
jgi:phage FluMu protein gp41